MSRRPAVLALLAAVLVGATFGSGCALPSPGEWVTGAREAHAEADAALARGDEERAQAVLAAFVEEPRPLGMNPHDRRAIVQDACFRLAEIDLGADRPADALAWADRGLTAGYGDDVFTANLLLVRGRAREALGQDRRAIVDYQRALDINEDLLHRALGTDG